MSMLIFTMYPAQFTPDQVPLIRLWARAGLFTISEVGATYVTQSSGRQMQAVMVDQETIWFGTGTFSTPCGAHK